MAQKSGINDITTSKEQVLKKIRAALLYKSKNQYPDIDLESKVYKSTDETPGVRFAKNLSATGGEFIFCHNRFDFLESYLKLIELKEWTGIYCWDPALKNMLGEIGAAFADDEKNVPDIKVGITSCEVLIARTGSVLVSSRQNSHTLTIYPEIHLVVAYTSQLCMEIKDAFTMLRNKYGNKLPSLISLVSGPSRTADIEKTIVMGAHGPKELYVFLIDDSI